MARTPVRKGLLTGCLLLAGTAPALAQNTPAPDVLLHSQFNPKQKDVAISTPTGADVAACKVNMVRGSKADSVGYELIDSKKQPLRRFMGAAKKPIETYSYYRDGTEVYREIDSNGDGRPDHYRWLNAGGMKWGIDSNGDHKIDAWRMISAEEVCQEALQALANHDFDRLKALFITEADMVTLKLPAAQVQRLAGLQKQAASKFEDVCKNMPQLAKAAFVRAEATTPSSVPGEQIGSDTDLIKYASRSILYEADATDKDGKKEKKHEWLNTGEMIQVGLAWRLIDVPTAEAAPTAGDPSSPTVAQASNTELTKRLEAITELDNKLQALVGAASNPVLSQRIALVQQILAMVDAKEQETWKKQLFDNYASLAQNGDKEALAALGKLRAQVEATAKGSALAAYGTYREIWTHYSLAISDPKKAPADIAKAQESWLTQLAKFVQDYPNAPDTTPEALHQLAIGAEFAGKEEEAKRGYRQIYSAFPNHLFAEKAKGAEERLNLVGKELKLAGNDLDGNAFDIKSLKGKTVVVYYYASYVDQCIGDFAQLKVANGNFELICVNLDDAIGTAKAFVQQHKAPGIQLFSAAPNATGLNSPLAVQYGINGLPTLFLIGKDGKVSSTRLQLSELNRELDKTK
jgi:hypothetical protein